MNTTQAIVTLKSGMKKFGTILNDNFNESILFIPSADILLIDMEQAARLIQCISVSEIESIDTYLK